MRGLHFTTFLGLANVLPIAPYLRWKQALNLASNRSPALQAWANDPASREAAELKPGGAIVGEDLPVSRPSCLALSDDEISAMQVAAPVDRLQRVRSGKPSPLEPEKCSGIGQGCSPALQISTCVPSSMTRLGGIWK